MDDEAEGGCESPVELDLGLVLLSTDSVQLCINERLHRVDVHEVLHGYVIWVAQHFESKWFVHILVQVGQLDQDFPSASVLIFHAF